MSGPDSDLITRLRTPAATLVLKHAPHIPKMNTTDPSNSTDYNSYLGYVPSIAANYAVMSIFAVLTICISIQTFRARSWFMLSVTIGGLMEVIGYATRIASKEGLGIYILSNFGILLAPTVYAIASYNTMSRLMVKLQIRHPIFTPKVVKWAFLLGDCFALLVQIGGGGISAIDDPEVSRIGTILLLVGLCIVLGVFSLFIFMTCYIHYKYIKLGQPGDLMPSKAATMMFIVLYIDMILLIIRSVYRIVEFAPLEYHNSISTNEALFYGLDALPIMLFHLLWIPFHPSVWGLVEDKRKGEKRNEEDSVTKEETAA